MARELPSEEVVGLSKAFIDLILAIEPKYDRAFYRCQVERNWSGSNASYVVASSVTLVDSIRHGVSLENLKGISAALIQHLEKEAGLLVLTVDADFNYDIKFEFDDRERWKITKLNGASGIPEGL